MKNLKNEKKLLLIYKELTTLLEQNDYDENELNLNISEKSFYQNQLQIAYNYWIESLKFKEGDIKKANLQSLAYEQIDNLANSLFPVDTDPIWPRGAQNIFKGVIYAMFEILENDINAIPLEKFNMVNVAKLLTQQEKLVEWFTKYKAIGNNAWKKSVLECSNEIFAPKYTMESFFATLSQGITIFKGEDTFIKKNLENNNKKNI